MYKKMEFCIKGFFSKYDQIRSFMRIWSHLLKKSLMKTFIFCAVPFLHGTFLIFLIKLRQHKGLKLTSMIFWGKILDWGFWTKGGQNEFFEFGKFF